MQPADTARQQPSLTDHFTIRLSSTGRGARLARRLTAERLAAWGIPYDTQTSQSATAVTHGRLPGRDLRLSLEKRDAHTKTVWAEITY
ncbi:hypothetical protein [Streptomyces sp. NPDC002671]